MNPTRVLGAMKDVIIDLRGSHGRAGRPTKDAGNTVGLAPEVETEPDDDHEHE